MTVQKMRWFVTRRPLPVIGFWLVLTAVLVAVSPDLTRLAAEGQANLLPKLSESSVAAALVRETWPDQSYQCTLVLGLRRESKLTDEDKADLRKCLCYVLHQIQINHLLHFASESNNWRLNRTDVGRFCQL